MAHLRDYFGKLLHPGLEEQIYVMLKLASPLWAGLDFDGTEFVTVAPTRAPDDENNSTVIRGHAGEDLFLGLCAKLRASNACGPPGSNIVVGGITYPASALRDFSGAEMVATILALVSTGERR